MSSHGLKVEAPPPPPPPSLGWLPGCCSAPVAKTPQTATTRQTTSSAICRRDFTSKATSSLFPSTCFTNHESIPSFQESYVLFIKAYPEYSDTDLVKQIRAREYPLLSLSDHVTFDYIGVGLFSQAQVKSTASLPSPHQPDFPWFGVTFKSVSLKSQLLHGGDGSDLESAIKKRIMDFLNISQSEYSMVFTTDKSSAFKLVAESYPVQSSRKLLTVYDHQSDAVDTMTNIAEKRGARAMAAEFKWPRLRIHSAKLRQMIVRKRTKKSHQGLFVFPLQSRVTGANYSIEWMRLAQDNGWHLLLDACTLGPKDMCSFGLKLFRPDFLICTFYKVFGENPTGFGCLFVKKTVVPILEDSTGAGIVSITPAKNLLSLDSSGTDTELEQITRLHYNQSCSPGHSEQASSDNQIGPIQGSIIHCKCLDHVDSLGLTLISRRGRCLANWLIAALMKLQHPNRLDDFPLVTIYGPKVSFKRGPALAFNIYDWKGERVDPVLVQKLAGRNNISLSQGFLKHIWLPERCEVERQRIILDRNMKGKETGSKSRKGAVGDEGISVVTAALTFLADFVDVYKLWAFIAQFLDADFVEKERWRYTALNQKTIEV